MDTVEQAVLGAAPSYGFQLLLSFHWRLISGRGSSVMPGFVQAEDARSAMVSRLTLRNTGAPGCWHPARVKKERTRNNHLSQGQVVLMWETFRLVHCPPPAPSLTAQTCFPKVQGKWEERGAGACCPLLTPVCEAEL